MAHRTPHAPPMRGVDAVWIVWMLLRARACVRWPWCALGCVLPHARWFYTYAQIVCESNRCPEMLPPSACPAACPGLREPRRRSGV
eukprot:363193-Chlamydomonas_euryale.AAC.3